MDDAFELPDRAAGLPAHPFRRTQIWVINSTCSSADSCVAQVAQTTPEHWTWTGTARFSIPTASVGEWTMVVDNPQGVACPDGSKFPNSIQYWWGPFWDGNGIPTATTKGHGTYSAGPACGRPDPADKAFVLTMTKVS